MGSDGAVSIADVLESEQQFLKKELLAPPPMFFHKTLIFFVLKLCFGMMTEYDFPKGSKI